MTGRVNTLRGNTIPAMHARKTKCINGHSFTRENTYARGPKGRWRRCKICQRKANQNAL